MSANDESPPSSLWVNHNVRHNVIVLTPLALFMATVRKADLAALDLGLQKCKPAQSLLPKNAWNIPIKNIERIQFKHVHVVVHHLMNKDVTVNYRDGRKVRKLTLTLDSQLARDEFVNKLNERLGTWPIVEKSESPILILGNYLYIILVISLMGILFSGIAVYNPPNDDGTLMSRYWYATGPWGIAVPAMVIAFAVLITGILQLRTPPIIVTYEPSG
jgi:hypothetical protein